MATAQQIKALITSHTEGDGARFLSVAMQVAAHAARTGKARLAADLRTLVDEAKCKRSTVDAVRPVPIARPGGELAGLVTASYPRIRLSDMILSKGTREQLHKAIHEHHQSDRLKSHGLQPRRRLLLVGLPGCGKTMTASALSGELGLPLFFVQLHTLITKFMGETAAKLHVVFDAMHETKGVYLFDEFDAIGAHRGAGNDVGEIRRVLNSFLQFLERDDSDSMVLAATNFHDMLDHALFRRFDDVIHYELPDAAMIQALIKNRLSMFGLGRLGWKSITAAACGLSHADVVRACEEAAKEVVLNSKKTITTRALLSALKVRAARADLETNHHRG